MRFATRRLSLLSLVGLVFTVGGCGGSSTPAPVATYTVSGQVTGDVVAGVTVTLDTGATATTTTTSATGAYAFTGLAPGSYTVTPAKATYLFTPASRPVTLTIANQTGQDFSAAFAGYSISGQVVGDTMAGVTVTLGGDSSRTTTSAADGTYSLTGLTNGSYTVTPSKTGYTFGPSVRPVILTGASRIQQDFIATARTYTISGTIAGGGGISVTLSGTSGGIVTAAADGSYAFSGLANGSYTVTPLHGGFTINPTSLTVTVAEADVPGQDFIATAIPFTISGHITNGAGAGVSIGVVLTGGPAIDFVFSDAAGYYEFTATSGTFTVTPWEPGFVSVPLSRVVTVGGGNLRNVDFIATADAGANFMITGTVAGVVQDGVDVTISRLGTTLGVAQTYREGTQPGTYVFMGLTAGTYLLTPSKPGYTFDPASRTVVVLAGDEVVAPFTSAARLFNVHGNVGGATSVTVTLAGGAAPFTTTTDGSGNYAIGVPVGAYTVTPSKTGYTFTPPSRDVTVSVGVGDVAVSGFTASASVLYAISGTVTGPWVQGVAVTAAGSGLAPVTTGPTGTYRLAGLPNEAFTLSASLDGYTFSPAAPSVTLNGADRTQDFAGTPAIASHSISGTISGAAGSSGRVYVGAIPSGCNGCSMQARTSIAGPGAYTLRGLRDGAYVITARRDVVGQGKANASDPSGVTGGPVTVAGADVSGADVALVTPATPSPGTLAPPTVIAGRNGVLLFWTADKDGNNLEKATSYDVSWGITGSANDATARVVARDDAHYFRSGLVDGTPTWFKVRSVVGGVNGAWSVAAAGTPGAVAGGFTVSGTVNFTETATGPLYIAVGDPNAGSMNVAAYPLPVSSPAAFSVSGVPVGDWSVYAILDQNGNGVIDEGDLKNVGGAGTPLVQVRGDVIDVIVNLSAARGLASTTTEHTRNEAGDLSIYSLQSNISDNLRRVVRATVVAGKGIAVPADLGGDRDHFTWGDLGTTRPAIWDTYTFDVLYDDGTSEVLTSSVSDVLDTFAQGLTADPGAPYTPGQPNFSWSAPLSPPWRYGYSLALRGPGAYWGYPSNAWMVSSAVTSVPYNADGKAVPASLSAGTYTWSVTVYDAAKNRAHQEKVYVVP